MWLAVPVQDVGTHAGTSNFLPRKHACTQTHTLTIVVQGTVIQAVGLEGSHVSQHHWADCLGWLNPEPLSKASQHTHTYAVASH